MTPSRLDSGQKRLGWVRNPESFQGSVGEADEIEKNDDNEAGRAFDFLTYAPVIQTHDAPNLCCVFTAGFCGCS